MLDSFETLDGGLVDSIQLNPIEVVVSNPRLADNPIIATNPAFCEDCATCRLEILILLDHAFWCSYLT